MNAKGTYWIKRDYIKFDVQTDQKKGGILSKIVVDNHDRSYVIIKSVIFNIENYIRWLIFTNLDTRTMFLILYPLYSFTKTVSEHTH